MLDHFRYEEKSVSFISIKNFGSPPKEEVKIDTENLEFTKN